MKRNQITVALVLVALLVGGCAGETATAAEPNLTPTRTVVSDLPWQDTPFGPQAAPVHGNFAEGQHITLIRFSAGLKTPLHTHSADYIGVVITGSTRHFLVGKPETEQVLPPGSHWFMPAGVQHVSECLAGSECIMALYQTAVFDFHVVE